MKSVILVGNIALPAGFVFNEIRQLNPGAATGCKVMFNQSDSGTCRICCD